MRKFQYPYDILEVIISQKLQATDISKLFVIQKDQWSLWRRKSGEQRHEQNSKHDFYQFRDKLSLMATSK